MKFAIVFAAIFAVALAAGQDSQAQVLRFESDNIGVDGYNYAYETSNQIQAQESGKLKDLPGDEYGNGIEARGSYSYLGDDGVTYTVNYIANENGFQPSGAHLPSA